MAKSKLKTHLHENNKESQSHLEESEQHFSDQCLKVLELLNKGIRLSVMEAVKHNILSLPRRLKDLRDRNGITDIKEEWVKNADGKRLYKIWYKEGLRPPTKKKVIQNHSENQKPLFT